MRLKKHSKPGTSPGLVAKTTGRLAAHVPVTVVDYTEDAVTEGCLKTVEECRPFKESDSVSWINVDGISDVDLVAHLGKIFGLHPLALEDCIHVPQRPKVEFYQSNVYIVTQMITPESPEGEQVSIFLGKDFVITLQEKPGDVFDPVRNRIRRDGSLLRKHKADFLAYALVDAIIDGYFPALEHFNDEYEALENEVVNNPSRETTQRIYRLKNTLAACRRITWPERDLVNALLRHETPLITDECRLYLKDCYDHIIQVLDVIETYRELMSGMMETYMSSISLRMNQVMKLLTVIATIFMPLTFIAGIYGMNFQHMPELNWAYGYPFALALMLAVAAVMLLFFRRKQWL
ncbi:MAG TPA: magnesium/cobalt transporter CorA [Planctomycetota bacterium]|nr:magnesium/cobalt transporter CorA [Planctomycetota bacterium]